MSFSDEQRAARGEDKGAPADLTQTARVVGPGFSPDRSYAVMAGLPNRYYAYDDTGRFHDLVKCDLGFAALGFVDAGGLPLRDSQHPSWSDPALMGAAPPKGALAAAAIATLEEARELLIELRGLAREVRAALAEERAAAASAADARDGGA